MNKKGGREKASMQKPTEGKMDSKKPSGPGKAMFGYTPAGRKGKKAQSKSQERIEREARTRLRTTLYHFPRCIRSYSRIFS